MRNDPKSEAAGIEARLDPTAPPDYRALAAQLAVAWRKRRPRRVGLGGGQGAGKSTLGRLIEAACAEAGLRAVVVGLDDYYLPRAQRLALAARTHPLFETRGLPGSHDVGALRAAMDALLEPGPVELPRFDKGRDDRVGTEVREGPFELVVTNPPFHDGREEDRQLITAFARSAASRKTRSGRFLAVCNRHLAYRDSLAVCFGDVGVVWEDTRFRIWSCGSPRA